MAGVLDGLRVLDFGRYIAGPFCAALLGDLGAEVIRIERIGGGEDRGLIPVGAGPQAGGAMFLAMNRNKLGMTLDPAAPKGREIVRKLVATADVVVANLPPAVLRSLALDLDSLRSTRPDIILTTVTGFGAGGPLSHKHGFDGIGQAMSGAVFLSGFAEQPIMTKVPWVDFGTAFLSAFGTLAALIERGKTGSGQKVEGALLRTATAIANAMLIEQSLTGVDRVATVNRGFNNAPGDIYQTRDGWIVTTVIGRPMFRRWCRMIGDESFLSRPPLSGKTSRAPTMAPRSRRGCLRGAPSGAAPRRSPRSKRRRSSPARSIRRSRRSTTSTSAPRDLLEKRDYPTLDRTVPIAPTRSSCRKRREPTAGRRR